MNQLTNYKYKIDFLIPNDTSSFQSTQTIIKSKYKKEKCNECNKRRYRLDETHLVCHVCYKTKEKFIPSGNQIVDDFIRYTQVNLIKKAGKMEFVPYNQFKNIEFIAEGGFSKIYKADWINDSPIKHKYLFDSYYNTIVLKKLNNSKNITSKELNELKIFYNYYTKWKTQYDNALKANKISPETYVTQCENYISDYFGITQDLNTQDFMIVMPYYSKGDLTHYISNDFYNIKWHKKLNNLNKIANGLINIHNLDIIHRDLHSGNIFFHSPKFGCLYPYIGDLGISKSATESTDNNENYEIYRKEYENFKCNNETTITELSDIGPVPKNNPGAIYRSRALSDMINSAMSLRSFRSQSVNLEKVKRKFEYNNHDDGQSTKRKKLFENENNDYFTKEIELDIDIKSLDNNEYLTQEYDFDI
ncbi:uncharacterized protein OCT59_021209 [Rhizophagus irregularis]|uniref:uncharacterized protein n=1 Tax=Rhizophagus irregularis TaxID=588596 RepID=UPI0019F1A0DB|nr:hypothetical protein OCT59_021209 [Rhizophagus irregularis]GBC27195.2 kinase-like domain-containing protein [Rhizophagus irregularis DAOM 181602=DAOM 197198]